MRIHAIIFDFNGVLVDDEPIHFRAFKQTIQEEGLDLDWEDYCEKYLPYDDHNLFLHFLKDQNRTSSNPEIERLIQVKSRHYFLAIGEEAPTIPSSIAFVNGLASTVAVAIASGAARQEIEFILDQLQLRQRFSPSSPPPMSSRASPTRKPFSRPWKDCKRWIRASSPSRSS